MSKTFQTLHALLRQHTSDLILQLSGLASTSIEEVQALLVIASYSDNGAVLIDIALHAANSMGLGESLEKLLSSTLDINAGEGTSTSTLRRGGSVR